MIFFLFVINVFANNGEILLLQLKYDNGEIKLQYITKVDGIFNEEKNQPENAYRLEIISFNEKILYSQKFNIDLVETYVADPSWFDEKGNQIYFPQRNETSLTVTETTVDFVLPYFENAKEINIYDKDNKLKLSIDVSHFATITGDGVSELEVDKDFEISKKGILYIIITFSSFLVVLGVLIFIHNKRDRKEKVERIKLYISKTKKRGYTNKQIRNELIKEGYTEDYFKNLL